MRASTGHEASQTRSYSLIRNTYNTPPNVRKGEAEYREKRDVWDHFTSSFEDKRRPRCQVPRAAVSWSESREEHEVSSERGPGEVDSSARNLPALVMALSDRPCKLQGAALKARGRSSLMLDGKGRKEVLGGRSLFLEALWITRLETEDRYRDG